MPFWRSLPPSDHKNIDTLPLRPPLILPPFSFNPPSGSNRALVCVSIRKSQWKADFWSFSSHFLGFGKLLEKFSPLNFSILLFLRIFPVVVKFRLLGGGGGGESPPVSLHIKVLCEICQNGIGRFDGCGFPPQHRRRSDVVRALRVYRWKTCGIRVSHMARDRGQGIIT